MSVYDRMESRNSFFVTATKLILLILVQLRFVPTGLESVVHKAG